VLGCFRTRLSPGDLLLTLAVVAVWGYTFVPIKVALVEVPPFALATLRFMLAAVPLVLFIKPPTMPWPSVVAYGSAIGVFQFGLLFLGIKLGMPAGLSSLVIQTQVFFTIVLAVVFAGDRLQRHNLVARRSPQSASSYSPCINWRRARVEPSSVFCW
jgi:O-acetylserine/cysteine efflux transporter